eukprot:jgi/Bigna1/68408/fgenesh1_pg.6_\
MSFSKRNLTVSVVPSSIGREVLTFRTQSLHMWERWREAFREYEDTTNKEAMSRSALSTVFNMSPEGALEEFLGFTTRIRMRKNQSFAKTLGMFFFVLRGRYALIGRDESQKRVRGAHPGEQRPLQPERRQQMGAPKIHRHAWARRAKESRRYGVQRGRKGGQVLHRSERAGANHRQREGAELPLLRGLLRRDRAYPERLFQRHFLQDSASMARMEIRIAGVHCSLRAIINVQGGLDYLRDFLAGSWKITTRRRAPDGRRPNTTLSLPPLTPLTPHHPSPPDATLSVGDAKVRRLRRARAGPKSTFPSPHYSSAQIASFQDAMQTLDLWDELRLAHRQAMWLEGRGRESRQEAKDSSSGGESCRHSPKLNGRALNDSDVKLDKSETEAEGGGGGVTTAHYDTGNAEYGTAAAAAGAIVDDDDDNVQAAGSAAATPKRRLSANLPSLPDIRRKNANAGLLDRGSNPAMRRRSGSAESFEKVQKDWRPISTRGVIVALRNVIERYSREPPPTAAAPCSTTSDSSGSSSNGTDVEDAKRAVKANADLLQIVKEIGGVLSRHWQAHANKKLQEDATSKRKKERFLRRLLREVESIVLRHLTDVVEPFRKSHQFRQFMSGITAYSMGDDAAETPRSSVDHRQDPSSHFQQHLHRKEGKAAAAAGADGTRTKLFSIPHVIKEEDGNEGNASPPEGVITDTSMTRLDQRQQSPLPPKKKEKATYSFFDKLAQYSKDLSSTQEHVGGELGLSVTTALKLRGRNDSKFHRMRVLRVRLIPEAKLQPERNENNNNNKSHHHRPVRSFSPDRPIRIDSAPQTPRSPRSPPLSPQHLEQPEIEGIGIEFLGDGHKKPIRIRGGHVKLAKKTNRKQ